MLALVAGAAPFRPLDSTPKSSPPPHRNPNPILKIVPPPNRRRLRIRLNSRSDGKNGAESEGEDGKTNLNDIRWIGRLLNPDPDNIAAVGLTGLLTWASVQVLWQLLLVSISILIAALKYTIVAALVIFILITLL
ncbi:hypothetical protein M569_10032 [Genlisea aurea]|uniref:Uncharacterized protein n=1 Tax=Genlisea aurea TaxID=192259 RepID=S8DXQ6_9LAMI|nr:hypothetical protein M569_10032 [Genlisea aurea]